MFLTDAIICLSHFLIHSIQYHRHVLYPGSHYSGFLEQRPIYCTQQQWIRFCSDSRNGPLWTPRCIRTSVTNFTSSWLDEVSRPGFIYGVFYYNWTSNYFLKRGLKFKKRNWPCICYQLTLAFSKTVSPTTFKSVFLLFFLFPISPVHVTESGL